MADLTPNHPAVEAAAREFYVHDAPSNDPQTWPPTPTGLADDYRGAALDALTAALPHLDAATEENLARLRGTPVGRALKAEGWEDGAQAAWGTSAEGWNGEHAERPGPPGVFRAQNPTFPNPYLETEGETRG